MEVYGVHVCVCAFFARDTQQSNTKHELFCQSGSFKKMPRGVCRACIRQEPTSKETGRSQDGPGQPSDCDASRISDERERGRILGRRV